MPTIRSQLKNFLKNGEDWERMNTPVSGVRITKTPAKGNWVSKLMVEINPLNEFWTPLKKRGLFVGDKKTLIKFRDVIFEDKVFLIIKEIEKVNADRLKEESPKRLVQIECSICFKNIDLTAEKSLTCLFCDRSYHAACLKTWLSEHNICPTCLNVYLNSFEYDLIARMRGHVKAGSSHWDKEILLEFFRVVSVIWSNHLDLMFNLDNWQLAVQMNFNDKDFNIWFVLNPKNTDYGEGTVENPSIVITAPFNVVIKLLTGEINLEEANEMEEFELRLLVDSDIAIFELILDKSIEFLNA